MTKKTELTHLDKKAFKDAMKDVKPLTHAKLDTSKTFAPSAIKRRSTLQEKNNHPDFFQFSDYETHGPVGCDDLIEFSRPGIQHKTLRKMRTGQYNIEKILDLHGMTVVEARETLARFLIECSHKKISRVLIIHGKGRSSHHPILKNKLNCWLRQTNDILAFCSAKPKAGGTGALYVLLKKRKLEQDKNV
jgi:DNA-nicking Smr family endonuclease